MRFSISLLTVICIASVIGTVLKQHEPFGNYVNQFGPFWAEVFRAVDLYTVYSAWWFLLILALPGASARAVHRPQCAEDPRRPEATTRSTCASRRCRRSTYRAQAHARRSAGRGGRAHRRAARHGGWKAKVDSSARERHDGRGTRAAPPTSSATSPRTRAIVLVCLGGLFDGDLVVRAQMLLAGQDAVRRRRHVPRRRAASTGSARTRRPSARNLLVPEGIALGHRGDQHVRRRGAAGPAVRRRAEEVHRRVLRRPACPSCSRARS